MSSNYIIALFPATNPCEVNNGNCSHLCLLSSISAEGYKCACPDNQVLTDNQKECKR